MDFHGVPVCGRLLVRFGGGGLLEFDFPHETLSPSFPSYILDAQERKWVRPTWPTESPQTPPGRQRHSASLIGSKRIYIFGGFDGNKWLQDLHVLDVGRMEENDLETSSVHTLIQNLKGVGPRRCFNLNFCS